MAPGGCKRLILSLCLCAYQLIYGDIDDGRMDWLAGVLERGFLICFIYHFVLTFVIHLCYFYQN